MARTTGPIHIPQGASCAGAGDRSGRPQNGRSATTSATPTIIALAATAAVATSTGSDATASAPLYFSSLPMKPRNGGKPAMENAAAAAAAAVTGSLRPSPARSGRNRLPASWSKDADHHEQRRFVKARGPR